MDMDITAFADRPLTLYVHSTLYQNPFYDSLCNLSFQRCTSHYLGTKLELGTEAAPKDVSSKRKSNAVYRIGQCRRPRPYHPAVEVLSP